MSCITVPHHTPPRNSYAYLAATLMVIGLGLASRKLPGLLPSALGKYPGDALWTLMIFTAIAAIRPAFSTRGLTVSALLISYAVEFSQLYREPWLDAVRASTPGHLVLGSAFSWMDLIAYTLGGVTGMWMETLLAKRRRIMFPSRRFY